MGRFAIDYFKCDLAELNFRILALSGYWPIVTNKKWIKNLHIIYCYICNFSVTSILFIQVLDIYLQRNDPLGLIKTLSMTSITIMCILRYYILMYQMHEILLLHKRLDDFKNMQTDSSEIEIFWKSNRLLSRIAITFSCMVIVCVVAWVTVPGLSKGPEKKLPFPYRLPVDHRATPVYEILYVYQVLAMVGFMNIVICVDLMFFCFLIRISSEYDILMKRIKAIGKYEEDYAEDSNVIPIDVQPFKEISLGEMKKFKDDLKKLVQFHQYILKEIKYLHKIFKIPAVIFFMAIILAIGVLVIDIIMVSKGLQLQKLQKVVYCLCVVSDAFLWCFFATILEEKGAQIGTVFYGIPWYQVNPKLRKELLYILTNSKKISNWKIGKIFPLNLPAFLDIIRITYNLVVLLYQTIKA